MKRDLSEEQVRSIAQALEEAIKNGPWGESNFLRVIGKNLQDIRDTFMKDAGHLHSNSIQDSHLAHRVALRSSQREIYISLYASDGGQLLSWERILANLPKHVTSRPIYDKEDDVKALISTKETPMNEAYAVVYVDQSCILDLPAEKMSKDKNGVNILAIKDKTIHMDNLTRFVHRNAVYRLVKGRLILQNAVSEDTAK